MKQGQLPSVEVTLATNLPEGHWLDGVGSLTLDKTDNKFVFTGVHLINGSGQVVCNCSIKPNMSEVVHAHTIASEWRFLYCPASVQYLRRIVGRILKGQEG